MKQRGFSLMELVVAVTILAMGVTVLARFFSSQVKVIEAQAAVDGLIETAESRLAEALADRDMDHGRTREGTEGTRRWRIEGRQYAAFGAAEGSALPSPRLIEVRVTVQEGRDGRSIRLAGLKRMEGQPAQQPRGAAIQ